MAASKKSAVRSAAGKLAAIYLALESAVRERGGSGDEILMLDSEEGRSALGQIADVLVAKAIAPVVQVAYQVYKKFQRKYFFFF